jgi:hypothetical protein
MLVNRKRYFYKKNAAYVCRDRTCFSPTNKIEKNDKVKLKIKRVGALGFRAIYIRIYVGNTFCGGGGML